MKFDDAFYNAFNDELEKEAILGAVVGGLGRAILGGGRALAAGGRAVAGAGRAVAGGTRASGSKLMAKIRRSAGTGPKPSVPASKGPSSVKPTTTVTKPPPAPKVTGPSPTMKPNATLPAAMSPAGAKTPGQKVADKIAKPKRTLMGDVKGVGSAALDTGKQMLPWMAMDKMQGGQKKPRVQHVTTIGG